MQEVLTIQDLIDRLPDPRQRGKIVYPLGEVMLLCLCGVISGCESFVDIARYGLQKEAFLRTLSPFENGTPSHDTLSAIFRNLDPEAFSSAFIAWASGVKEQIGGVVAIDGKTSRGSKDKDGSALHMISAYCDDAGLVLGQRASSHKKNEIADIPELLALLSLKGCVVTIDAMGCQKNIASTIMDREADYVLALKGNQGTLHEDVKLWFEEADLSDCDHIETVDANKGRLETRNYRITDDINWLKDRHPGWRGLASIGLVKSRREIDGKVTEQKRLFIASITASAPDFAHAVRSHWAIENKLHWVLDMIFRDDEARVRKDHGPKNFTTIKHMALNMLRAAKTKQSIRVMRKEAGWNNQILRDILTK